MDIKVMFRGIYVNHAARVSLFAKLLLQRHYSVIIFLANKPFFSLANGMELGGIGFRMNYISFYNRSKTTYL